MNGTDNMAIQLTQQKAILLHIPKTGGTWVTFRLFDHPDIETVWVDPKHGTLHNPGIREKVKNLYSFAFVRHPIDWYKSYWAFQSQKDWRYQDNAIAKCQDENFSNFIYKVYEQERSYLTRHFQDFCGENWDQLDFLGTQENIREDLKKVFHVLDISADNDFFQAKQRLKTDYAWKRKAVYSKKAKSQVLEMESNIIEHFYE